MIQTQTRTLFYSQTQALEIFTEAELQRWWNARLSKIRDSADFLEFGLEWETFSQEIESLPEVVPLNLAFALFQEHRWFRFLGISEGLFFSSAEEELQAIRLGVSLRDYLKRPELGIGNSCQTAVQRAKECYAGIYWIS